jgi:hypothetical protein
MTRLRLHLGCFSVILLAAIASGQFEAGRLIGHDAATCGTSGYGSNVSLDGDTAIASDPYNSCDAAYGGAAYVFRRVGGNWVEESKLVASDVAEHLYFGWSVAVQGDRAYVGAYGSGPGIQRPGAVYVFRRSGSFPFVTWTQQSKITASDATPGDAFGFSVSVSGGSLAVLAHQGSGSASAIYVYGWTGSAWVEQQKLLAPPGSRHSLLVLDGSTLAARRMALPNYNPVGVDIFDRNGGLWMNTATLITPAQFGSDDFAASFGLDNDRLIVGAPKADTSAAGEAGCFYLYRRIAGVWDSGTRVEAEYPIANGRFAQGVAIENDTALAFSLYHQPGVKPTIVAYDLTGGTVTKIGQLRANSPDPLGSGVAGNGLALSDDALVCGTSQVAVAFSLTPPTPEVYCVPKISSAGCTPSISSSGSPSASGAAPFVIGAASIINHRFGLLFFGLTGRTAFPFQGGTLCVLPPTRRTPTQDSGGSLAGTDCTGTYSFDFNPLIQSGTEPGLGAGVYVNAQYWYRDPASPSTTGLTDAIEFGIGF